MNTLPPTAYAHARAKAHERYGMLLSAEDVERIGRWCRRVGKSPARLVVEQSSRSAWFWVRLRRRELLTVYDPHGGVVLTFLPRHSIHGPAFRPWQDCDAMRTLAAAN